jgi:NAD+ kinase
MQRIGVLYNPHSEISVQTSVEVAEWIQRRGLGVWRGVSHEGRTEPGMEQLDLLVALGGDGTVLRAARLAIICDIPVLPVALGRLNFMAELQPENMYAGLDTLLRGGGWYDERTLALATIEPHHADAEPIAPILALNEILLARGDINRIVTTDVYIDDTYLTTYHADGVLVATATGSTAYALSAGGPIIDPRSRALVMVPVAAHLTDIHSLVLHEDTEVRIVVRSRHAAAFSVDGRDHLPIGEGDNIRVRRAEQTCKFARVYPQKAFYTRMARRLRRFDDNIGE